MGTSDQIWSDRPIQDPPEVVDGVGMEHLTLVQRAHLVGTGNDRCTGGLVTTLVLDPDDFHDVSDRLGGEVADHLLAQLADVLQTRLCGCGVTTHLSHDQLGIDCIGLSAGDRVDEDVVRALLAPFVVGDDLVEVRAS